MQEAPDCDLALVHDDDLRRIDHAVCTSTFLFALVPSRA